jgi:hypothetical protein
VNLELSPEEARAIAEEAYLLAYPSVRAYLRFWSSTQDPRSPALTLLDHLTPIRSPARPGDSDPTDPWPDAGTIRSSGWWDLRREPLVLATPVVPGGRYHAVAFTDVRGRTFAIAGGRTTGEGATTVLVAGPDWNGFRPATVDAILHVPSELVEVTVRLGVDGSPADQPNANALQDSYQVTPLSTWRGQDRPPPAPQVSWPKVSRWVLDGVPQLLEIYQHWTAFASVEPGEEARAARFASIGLRPGADWSPGSLPGTVARAIEDGVVAAHARIVDRARSVDGRISGWTPDLVGHPSRTGPGMARVGGDGGSGWSGGDEEYLVDRAASALLGLADDPGEVTMFRAGIDATDQPFDASHSDYRLRFEDLPPSDAGWSITLYDAGGGLVGNEVDRNALGDHHPHLVADFDGGITLQFSYEPPHRVGLANWLPAPDGPFALVLRIYLPHAEALDGRWTPPPVERYPRSGSTEDLLRWRPTRQL